MSRRPVPMDTLAATDEWFLRNGLSYFVPEQRQGVKAALSLRRTLPLLVLTILARRGPLHGYAITTQIQHLSDVLRVEEGSLYPSLHRMEEVGWIKARQITTEHNRRARAYEITADGRRQLGIEEERWRSTTSAINHVLKHA